MSDPQGILDVDLVAPFDDDAVLPDDASDTGYHRDGRQLWLSADGTIAHLVAGDQVEAWPGSTDPFGCA